MVFHVAQRTVAALIGIGQIIWVHPDIIRRRIIAEAYGLDVTETFQKCFTDTMHSVHYPPIARKNDRKAEIAIENEPRMLHNITAGQSGIALPIAFIQLSDGGKRNALTSQVARHLDKPMYIPCAEAVW